LPIALFASTTHLVLNVKVNIITIKHQINVFSIKLALSIKLSVMAIVIVSMELMKLTDHVQFALPALFITQKKKYVKTVSEDVYRAKTQHLATYVFQIITLTSH